MPQVPRAAVEGFNACGINRFRSGPQPPPDGVSALRASCCYPKEHRKPCGKGGQRTLRHSAPNASCCYPCSLKCSQRFLLLSCPAPHAPAAPLAVIRTRIALSTHLTSRRRGLARFLLLSQPWPRSPPRTGSGWRTGRG
jgi:hypothetical protein